MTEESLPVDKSVGDEVSSCTVNQFGAFDMKATKVGEDSSIQRMIRLVQSADVDKATFSMTLNFLANTLAITGLLGPVIGALVHNAGSVAVIINSALLLKWRKRKW